MLTDSRLRFFIIIVIILKRAFQSLPEMELGTFSKQRRFVFPNIRISPKQIFGVAVDFDDFLTSRLIRTGCLPCNRSRRGVSIFTACFAPLLAVLPRDPHNRPRWGGSHSRPENREAVPKSRPTPGGRGRVAFPDLRSVPPPFLMNKSVENKLY